VRGGKLREREQVYQKRVDACCQHKCNAWHVTVGKMSNDCTVVLIEINMIHNPNWDGVDTSKHTRALDSFRMWNSMRWHGLCDNQIAPLQLWSGAILPPPAKLSVSSSSEMEEFNTDKVCCSSLSTATMHGGTPWECRVCDCSFHEGSEERITLRWARGAAPCSPSECLQYG
jgi:hypothetical protein